MTPSVGRIVHYTLSQGDADEINRRRNDAGAYRRRIYASPEHHEIKAGETGRTGHVEHFGNPVSEGDVYPAVVVRLFSPSATTANLQVLLDGNDHYWATSRMEGGKPGNWSWPPRT